MPKDRVDYYPLFLAFDRLASRMRDGNHELFDSPFRDTRLSYELATLRDSAKIRSKNFPEKLLKTVVLFTDFILDHARQLLPMKIHSRGQDADDTSLDSSFESASSEASDDASEASRSSPRETSPEKKEIESDLDNSEFAKRLQLFRTKYIYLHTQLPQMDHSEAGYAETLKFLVGKVFRHLDECLYQLRILNRDRSPEAPPLDVAERLKEYKGFSQESQQPLLSIHDGLTFFTGGTRRASLSTQSPARKKLAFNTPTEIPQQQIR